MSLLVPQTRCNSLHHEDSDLFSGPKTLIPTAKLLLYLVRVLILMRVMSVQTGGFSVHDPKENKDLNNCKKA